MSNFYSTYRKKILIAILCLTIFYLGLIIYQYLTIKIHKGSFQTQTRDNIDSTAAISTTEAQLQQLKNPLRLTEVYKNPTFSLQYPRSFRVIMEPFRGGESVIFQDDFFQHKPRLVVEVYDTAVDITPKVKLYVAEGFSQRSTQILGKTVTELSATMPFRVSEGKIIQGAIQQKIIYMPMEKNLFAFKYYYDGISEDPSMETFFQQMIATTQFPR